MDLMRGLRTFPGCGRATRWQIQPEFCFLRAKGDEPDIKDQCLLSLVLQFSFCGLHPCLSVSFSPSILNNGLNRFSSGQQFSNEVMEYAGYCSQRKCHSRARNARWTHVTMTCYYYYCHYPRSVRVSCRVEAPRMENSSSSGVDSQAVVTELLDWSIAISRTIRSHCCLEVCTGNLWQRTLKKWARAEACDSGSQPAGTSPPLVSYASTGNGGQRDGRAPMHVEGARELPCQI